MFYTVSVLLESIGAKEGCDSNLWQECIFLVEASSDSQAREIASNCARSEEVTYRNVDGEMVRWKIHGIATVHELPDGATTGSEIFSRFLRASEAKSLTIPFD